MSAAWKTFSVVGGGERRYQFTRQHISDLPYASMGVSFGSRAAAVMILASYDGPDLHWVSADSVLLATRGGRLVKTVGLPRDVRGTLFENTDPVTSGLHQLRGALDARYALDLLPGDEFGVPVESTFEPVGAEKITILDLEFETVKIEEKIRVRAWGWSAVNTYWADVSTGFVWRSTQQFCPQTPAVTLEVLKPAA
jgi:hypothetical protein